MNEEKQEQPEASHTRKVFIEGKWQCAKVSQDELTDAVSTLMAHEIEALYQGAIMMDVSRCSEAAIEVFNLAKGLIPQLLLLLTRARRRKVSVQDTDARYTCSSLTTPRGTRTTYKATTTPIHYMWGEPMRGERPDEAATTARLLSTSFEKVDTGVKILPESVPKRYSTLYPTNRVPTAASYLPVVQECRTQEAIHNTLLKHTQPDGSAKQQICKDIEATCPTYVKGLKTTRIKGGHVLVKGKPTAVKATSKGKHTFPDLVDIAVKLSATIGSRKKGLGSIREHHYDGIPILAGAARDRHEWLTDFKYQTADVYLMRTKNPTIACALYRCVKKSNKGKFVVVYEALTRNSVKYDELITTRQVEKETTTTVKKSGVLGVPSLNWTSLFGKLDTYYISFRPPVRSKGTDSQHVHNSIQDRRPEHAMASVFNKYMYYGALASMEKDDKVVMSCKARDARVIFSNVGTHTRDSACYIVLNIIRHAIIYPYIHSPYIYKEGEDNFYPGVRPFKSEYDFSLPGKSEPELADLGDVVQGNAAELNDEEHPIQHHPPKKQEDEEEEEIDDDW